MKKQLLEILKNSMKFGSIPVILSRNNDEESVIAAVFSSQYSEPEIVSEHGETISKNNSAFAADTEFPEADRLHGISLKDQIRDCTICGSASEKKYPSGSTESGLMVILNAPMLMSSFEKKQFRDESVEMLKNIIVKGIGFQLKDVYITNVIKCEADSLLSKPSTMFRNCERIIRREIDEISPSVILVMGDMLPLRPILRKSENIQWYNIDHPITILKHSELKRRAWNTIVELKNYLEELS